MHIVEQNQHARATPFIKAKSQLGACLYAAVITKWLFSVISVAVHNETFLTIKFRKCLPGKKEGNLAGFGNSRNFVAGSGY